MTPTPKPRLAVWKFASCDGNEIDPAAIRIGEPVRVVFAHVEDVALPRWVRAG